jgi:hypothetical protein
MKNIHLIPTNKPSRLIFNPSHKSFCIQKELNGMYINDGKVSGADFWGLEKALNNGFRPQHLYITNDEKIKDGNKSLLFVEGFKMPIILTHFEPIEEGYEGKKIIITTDPQLIADGVQAIDDEFLEWFVKNPTCEFVKLDSACKCVECGSSVKSSCDYAYKCRPQISYEIIIPQEKPKQETLEEAAELSYLETKYRTPFIAGAKSDAARDYWFEQFKKK